MQATTRQTIQILNTNHTRFKAFLAEAEIEPCDSKGQELHYDLAQVVKAWLASQLGKRENKLDKDAEDARYKKARADREEIEVAELQNKLMSREEIEAEVEDVLGIVRSRLLGIPDILINRTFGLTDKKKAKAIAEKYIFETLEELSKIEEVKTFEAPIQDIQPPAQD